MILNEKCSLIHKYSESNMMPNEECLLVDKYSESNMMQNDFNGVNRWTFHDVR